MKGIGEGGEKGGQKGKKVSLSDLCKHCLKKSSFDEEREKLDRRETKVLSWSYFFLEAVSHFTTWSCWDAHTLFLLSTYNLVHSNSNQLLPIINPLIFFKKITLLRLLSNNNVI